MKNPVLWFAVVLIAGIAGGFYFWLERTGREARVEQMPPQNAPAAEASPPASAEGEPAHPLPEVSSHAAGEEVKPLPPLTASDETLAGSVAALLNTATFNDIIIAKDLARRFVATVDNLPRNKLAERLLPVKPASGAFQISGSGEIVILSATNYHRYARYVALAQAVDAKHVVELYVRFYPLFQQAYRELGYPKKQFNDRLVQAIDDLLAAPSPTKPVELVRPKVLYEFEDPALQSLSAGQKIMIRIGPENAAVVKAKLNEIRGELTAGER
jgi:hypothetical protein